MITNANASLKTIRNTVNCPFCETGFTFRSEEKRQNWIASGRKEPLHASCIQAAKSNQKVGTR